MNLNVNYFRMIIMCQCRFTDCNKTAALMKDVESVKVVHMWDQGVYGNSVLSTQFYWVPNTALKIVY